MQQTSLINQPPTDTFSWLLLETEAVPLRERACVPDRVCVCPQRQRGCSRLDCVLSKGGCALFTSAGLASSPNSHYGKTCHARSRLLPCCSYIISASLLSSLLLHCLSSSSPPPLPHSDCLCVLVCLCVGACMWVWVCVAWLWVYGVRKRVV